jgi:thiamine pyrophosphate-dependent acetolactate synthase large subunit-like protein
MTGAEYIAEFLAREGLPFVSSWAGLTFFDHDHPGFLGQNRFVDYPRPDSFRRMLT